jgi:O-antigen/teichoic acid export membrane protein
LHEVKPTLNPLKRLVSQTAVYGVSSVFGRFLNYLLVPLFTYTFAPVEYGVVAEFYAYMGFLAVLLVFGLETGYFRFRECGEHPPEMVYTTALRFVIFANAGFLGVMLLFQHPVAALLHYGDNPEYIGWVATILALDSVGAVAFARLRAENKATRFAVIKVLEIGVNIGLNLFFIVWCRQAFAVDPNSFFGRLWDPAVGVGYIFLANLTASSVKLLMLSPELRGALTGFDGELFNRLIRYSLPMVIIGFAGVVNEMLDRAALKYLLPYDLDTNLAQLGIYSACYKLSILMSLFIQAFRYAGEPFFFAYARQADARQTYAVVLNYFVIFCVFIFLLVTLYIDIFKYFIGAPYRAGLHVVPVLLLANLFLGIYVNLSIWYKLTDRTVMGAWVALTGAVITSILLLWWVPVFGYEGAAWAHLSCYASMTVLSYLLGRKYYPVPYDTRRVLGYVLVGVLILGTSRLLIDPLGLHASVAGTLGLTTFLALVFLTDGRYLLGEFKRT